MHVVKNRSLYVKPRPKLLAVHSTHDVGYISPAEMLRIVIFVCNYLRRSHVAAVVWPSTYLFIECDVRSWPLTDSRHQCRVRGTQRSQTSLQY